MAPPLPVIERITEVIATRLRTIKMANGYAFDIGDVVRPTRTGAFDTPRGLGCVISTKEQDRNEALDCPGNPPAIAWTANFDLECFVRDSSKSDVARSTGENVFLGAVLKAMRNTSYWYTMDGLAIIADFGVPSPFSTSTGDHGGISIPLMVTYRVSEDDPSEVR